MQLDRVFNSDVWTPSARLERGWGLGSGGQFHLIDHPKLVFAEGHHAPVAGAWLCSEECLNPFDYAPPKPGRPPIWSRPSAKPWPKSQPKMPSVGLPRAAIVFVETLQNPPRRTEQDLELFILYNTVIELAMVPALGAKIDAGNVVSDVLFLV